MEAPTAEPSQSGISIRVLLTWVAVGWPLTALYAFVAFSNPELASSLLVWVLTVALFFLGTTLAIVSLNEDRLDPLRMVGAVFVVVYCIAPLLTVEVEWLFRQSQDALRMKASAYALFALVVIAVGYHLPLTRSVPRWVNPIAVSVRRAPLIAAAAILFGFGIAAYAFMFLLAGGLGVMIEGGESRVQFFKGFGYLYHAVFLMIPGGALFYGAWASRSSKIPWLTTGPLLVAFGLLILLQGRFRAFRALATLLFETHHLVRRISFVRIALIGAAVLVLFLFVGYARDPDVRFLLVSNPAALLAGFRDTFIGFAEYHLGDGANRQLQLMLIFDNYPDRASHWWGMTFVVAFNPIMRFVGLASKQVVSPGMELFQLARPEMPSWLETGYHPSLVGEMLMNFPWYLAFLPLMAYGLSLRALYSWLLVDRRDVISVALYSVLIFPILSMVIVGVGQMFFEMATMAVPLLLIRRLLHQRTGTAFVTGGLPDSPTFHRGHAARLDRTDTARDPT